MRLMNARLCLDCEEVHDEQHRRLWFGVVCLPDPLGLAVWTLLRPKRRLATRARPTLWIAGNKSMPIDEILNPTPPAQNRGRIVARGALGLALLGVARMIWRATPRATIRFKTPPGTTSQNRRVISQESVTRIATASAVLQT